MPKLYWYIGKISALLVSNTEIFCADWPASNNLHLLIQLSWRLCTDCYFRYCSIYHIICKYSNYMIYWWINIKFKSNSSDINYYNPYLNKHYLRRYIQSIWYSISYKYSIHFTQSTENSEGITKINYGWRKENKSKENIGIQKDYSPLRLISVSSQNIQVSIFFWKAK